MRITFLGASHGVPEPNRRCSCAMIEVQGSIYFIDMGVMVIDELRTRGIPVESVKAAFLTHVHGDHTNGLIHFVDLCSWYFKNADPLICVPDMAMKQVIDDWLRVTLSHPRDIRFQEIAPGVIYDDGLLKVTAIATQHCARSHAFLVEADGKAVLFTGDLKRPGVDFPAAAKERPLDLIIAETAHFPATEYEPVLKECDCKRICINHYQGKLIGTVLELAGLMEDRNVFMAHDGLEINV